jgi:hypothetical protein
MDGGCRGMGAFADHLPRQAPVANPIHRERRSAQGHILYFHITFHITLPLFCGCSLPTSKVCGKRTRKRKDVRSVLADTPPNCYLTRAIHTTTALIVARRDVGGITLGRERGTGLAFKRGAGVFIYPHAWPLGPRAS